MSGTTEHGRPRISVVTPSYNQGRFLDRCIRSVLEQGYPDLEYFILDGGSTDESVEVIRRYQDRLTFWVSERDGGQSAAINRGFGMATGDVVAWMNADDFYLPGAFDRVAAAYQENPQASFYFGDGWRVDEAGERLSNFFPEGRVLYHHPALVYGLDFILQPSTFIHRGRLAEAGYLNADLKYGMDSDLWLRLAKLAPPVAIPEALAVSREYGATKTSTGSFHRVEELRQICEKHSGLSVTPGALLYYLDTLHKLAEQRPDIFPLPFLIEIQVFSKAAQRLLGKYGARPDGFPAVGPEELDRCLREIGVSLSAMLLTSEEDRAARQELIEQLSARLQAADADRAARQELIKDLSARLAAAHQEVQALRNRTLGQRLRRLPGRAYRLVRRAWAG
jgi:hypothetical protein